MVKITKKQEVIDLLRTVPGIKEDNWGNFKTEEGNIRYKINKSAIRYEKKSAGTWMRIWSAYYKHITVVEGKLKVAAFN